MKNKFVKAFTIVEIMIVVVILGLLAAMVIPAVQKVRENAVVKKVEKGMKLSDGEKVIYKEYLDNGGKKVSKGNTDEVEKSVDVKSNGYIVIKNKNDIKEVQINGETVYLVPVK